jgi:hypothetical protein
LILTKSIEEGAIDIILFKSLTKEEDVALRSLALSLAAGCIKF